MKKIKFTIDKEYLKMGYRVDNNVIRNLNNTNIISDEDLIFDPKYLKNNLELVSGFIRVIVENSGIKEIHIEEKDLIITGFSIISYVPSIKKMIIKPDVDIDYEMHLEILKNDTLREIECYSIPSYLLERIDTTKSVKIKTRSEVFFKTKFTRDNELNSYSDIFYKRKVEMTYVFEQADYKDFETFLSINGHLKYIYFDTITLDYLKTILNLLKHFNKKNINISIMGTTGNLLHFEKIEAFIKKNKYVKDNKIKFKIDYTKEYKNENYMKLVNFTTLKYALVAIMLSAIVSYGIDSYNMFLSGNQVDDINANIADLLEEFEEYEVPVIDESTYESNMTSTTESNTQTNNAPTYVSPYYKNYSKVISVLKESNPDTVGWLTVKNTTVNYPVVQSTNNSYYLTHDFNKMGNSFGWVFMDYRNSVDELQQNTIIYGHNINLAKLMFGNLSETLKESWYKNKSNHIITFNTINADMKWHVFSVYTTPATNDYLYNKFGSEEMFMSFATKLKDRSIYDFGVEIKPTDKILTLSTCQSRGKDRLVVHAILEE